MNKILGLGTKFYLPGNQSFQNDGYFISLMIFPVHNIFGVGPYSQEKIHELYEQSGFSIVIAIK